MSGFHRIGAPEATPGTRRRHDGRRAVFSGVVDGPQGIDRWMECTVVCARCARSRGIAPTRLLLACVPFALIVPWRDHPLLARCPSCARMAWLQVRYPVDQAAVAVD